MRGDCFRAKPTALLTHSGGKTTPLFQHAALGLGRARLRRRSRGVSGCSVPQYSPIQTELPGGSRSRVRSGSAKALAWIAVLGKLAVEYRMPTRFSP